MKRKNKGFTLIELLAVIVILGLLMAIAIPSVTKYITQSRKKTVTTTIGNYISALTNEVNDMNYVFTETNTIYAVPIECISLERGGTNPFGEWHQASNSYWAYVLVQYVDNTSSYTYGFTFKDSAGYGLYPTSAEKLNENGKQINTGLDLTRPTSGSITNITAKVNWTGFEIEDDTKLVVLEATSEGENGDGKTTCTLCQKGSNYDAVEQEKVEREKTLTRLIKKHNTVITAAPTLTTTSYDSGDADGLYISNATNSGQPTYYFRGKVTNNYVKFAGLTWRIVRINENGTIRMILSARINNANYLFSSSVADFSDLYYSNSDTAKPTTDSWYKTNIVDTGYDSYVSTEMFCEQAKACYYCKTGNAVSERYTTYEPNFKCSTDGNGKGILNEKVGLITYDELLYAGNYYNIPLMNKGYYLITSRGYWTMSPSGFPDYPVKAFVWSINDTSNLTAKNVDTDNINYGIRPVINLNANVTATGTGTSSDPYVVQTN